MTDDSLTLLYCIVVDFIHRFLEASAGKRYLHCITAGMTQNVAY